MRTLAYHMPGTLRDAFELFHASEDARYLGGGTDLLVGPGPRPRTLVSLRRIPELGGIREGRIGALTSVGDVVRDDRLARDYPVLVQAARRLGSEQIRNAATVGGNLCRAAPCADLAPPLLVLGARAEIVGRGGTREVPLDELFRGPGETCIEPGEILSAVLLPTPPPAASGIFLKAGRVRMDLALASVALLLDMEGGVCRRARVAAGSVAPTPLRLREVESLLEGSRLSDADVDEAGTLAAGSVLPITDVRSTEAYRRHLVGVFVRRALRASRREGG